MSNKTIHSNKESLGVPFNTEFTYKDLLLVLIKYIFNTFLWNRFILKNLQPGEAVVVIDYKMKLELGIHAREVQRDWYGKRGISLHGFYVLAQVSPEEKQVDVLDVWSDDTKQGAWFTQSALDVGFAWMEKAFPSFHVYLFSGKYFP